MDKERIAGLKTEISRIKDFILMNKKNIDAKKSDIKKVNERFKAQIARADRSEKASLREKKKREIEHLKDEIEAQKRQILDKKRQIENKREDIKRIKNRS